MPAPLQDAARPKLLATQVDGVPYPYWDDLKWDATRLAGRPQLDGRRITTVFYDRAGKRVGYQIIPGDRVAPPVATEQQTIDGTVFRTFKADGTDIVTWVRGDHTCVLSGQGVPPKVLVKLASWSGGGDVPF